MSEGVELVVTSIMDDRLTRGTCKSHIRNGAFSKNLASGVFFYYFEEENSKTYSNLNPKTIVPFSLCDLQVPLVLTPLWFYAKGRPKTMSSQNWGFLTPSPPCRLFLLSMVYVVNRLWGYPPPPLARPHSLWTAPKVVKAHINYTFWSCNNRPNHYGIWGYLVPL